MAIAIPEIAGKCVDKGSEPHGVPERVGDAFMAAASWCLETGNRLLLGERDGSGVGLDPAIEGVAESPILRERAMWTKGGLVFNRYEVTRISVYAH